jgi:hypothetical protein
MIALTLEIMAEGTDNLILEHLRQLRAGMDGLCEDMHEVKGRLTSLENRIALLQGEVALIHGDFAGQSARIDRVDIRLERIERRLDLIPAS